MKVGVEKSEPVVHLTLSVGELKDLGAALGVAAEAHPAVLENYVPHPCDTGGTLQGRLADMRERVKPYARSL